MQKLIRYMFGMTIVTELNHRQDTTKWFDIVCIEQR